ncbi:Cadmium, zinc and cobalt-transporting ATPase [bioreactor metagenome]|uniref:Cadmium, zinc and cobalt-transporting ATPase n=1 Tax=bioreactor metagenome TaxID=1076179 RepID=A0A645CZF1_9ZZZZ
MKKTFQLKGLDCANCAAKIERAIGKLHGVSAASVQFVTAKMTIEAEDIQMEAIIKEVKAIVKKIEPDVVVI